MQVKAVLIGDSGVGKTSIFQRLESDTFNEDHVITVGGAYTKISTKNSMNIPIDIGFWDTAGQERFRNVIPMYFQKAHFVIAVYDITNKDSFNNLNQWVEIVRDKAPEDVKIIFIGNKADIENRQVEYEDAEKLCKELGGCAFLETSAKTRFGLDDLINEITNLCDNVDDKEKEEEIHVNEDNKNDTQERKSCPC